MFEDLAELNALAPPDSCAGATLFGCITALRTAPRDSLPSSMTLFRRKADFVNVVNTHLDDLTSPRARDYMACRAALAAKDDHDPIADDAHRSTEASRRQGDFFRIEATIGIE